MITIDCHELSTDEELALASSISDALQGRGIALTRDKDIVIDSIVGPPPDFVEIEVMVRRFIGKRHDSSYYSVESMRDMIVIHSPDPIKAAHGRKPELLPDNLLKCPFCGFVSPYEEAYNVHLRAHGFNA